MARTVAVILDAIVAPYNRKMAEAAKATEGVATAAEGTGKSVDKSTTALGGLAAKAKGVGKAVEREFEVMQDAALANEQAWSGVQNSIGLVGAAAAAVGVLAVREFADFDAAMSGVASTGADAKGSIDDLREAAIDMGAGTAFSATEAAQGIEELARAGVSAEEVLAGGLSGALDLAAAGQIGVAESAGIAATAMTQFKLKGDQIPHLADLLAAGAGKAMGGVDDLGQALQQGGLVASQFGLSIEETVGGLSAFAAAGLLGSDAGTSMKTMLLALANPSSKAQRTMDELGIAAYDAQGSFIGLEGLAGQLQERMAGLTDAQRQQALATIFGTDAIRPASILYEQGAEGIREWTTAVNDSGYAAETAAELQNNMIGDLEKLGGAWSTLAIEMGEAADGPLRTAVQALTGLLDAMGESPALAGGLMLTVTAIGALGLGAAALMKGISTYAQFRTHLAELTALNPRIGKTATVIGKVGKAAGIAAIAFAGMMAAKGVIDMLDGTATGADNAAAAMERLQRGTGDLDSVFQTTSGGTLVATVDSITSAMERYAGRGLIYMDQLDEFMSGLTGQASDLDQVRAQFALLDDQISQMDADAAAEMFSRIRDMAKETGMPVEDLIALFPEYAGQIQKLAAANGEGELSGNFLADAMEGVYPPLMGVGDAAEETAPKIDHLAQAQADAAEAAKNEREAMNDLLDALQAADDAIQSLNDTQTAAANAFLSSQAAQDKYIATLQAVDQQIKDNGVTLDENTEKGRANREYLRGLATDARSATDSMIANGDGIEAANAKMAEQREQLIETAGKFNVTGQAAEDMADDMGLIPNYVEVLIATPGAKLSKEEADDLNESLEGLPDEVKTQIIAVAQREGFAEAERRLNELARARQTTLTVDIIQRGSVRGAGRGIEIPGAQNNAAGGKITGPGTGTSDSILSWLSNGEVVLSAWAAQKIGYDRLLYANKHGELPAFRDGGRVGPMSPTATSGAFSAPNMSGGSTYVDNRSYSYEGREALAYVIAHTRDADLNRYATMGVHN